MDLCKLKECCTLIAGQSPKSKYYNTEGVGVPFFQGKADFGDLYPTIRVYCSQPIKLAEKNDILLSVRAPVGSTNLSPGVVCIGRGLTAVRPNDNLNLKYLLYFFRHFEKLIQQKGKGTTFTAITQDVLKNIEIPLPPLSEQERIVARIEELFSAIDKGVETLHTLQRQLAVYRQAVLKEAFDGNLILAWRKPHSSKKWRMMAIEEFLPTENKGMNTGPFGSMLKKSEHQKSGVPVLGIENIGNGIFLDGNKIFVTPQKAIELNSFRVKQGDVIISRSGTVGKLCTVPPHMNNALLSSNLMKISLNESIILPEFFVYLFQSKGVVIDQVKELCRGSTREYLNQKILKSIQFPIPSIEEQVEIISMLESRLSLCDKIEQIVDQSLRQAEALRQSILRQAFSGELQ